MILFSLLFVGHSADFKFIIKSLDPQGKEPAKREKIKGE